MLLWLGLAAACGQILRGGERLWIAKAAFILALGAVGVALAPRFAGWAVGVSWFVLLALPGLIITRLVSHSLLSQNYGLAAWLAGSFRVLHPDHSWLGQPTIMRAMRLARHADAQAAIELLRRVATWPGLPAETKATARFHHHRLEGHPELWLAETPLDRAPSPALVLLRLRAFALLGQTDNLVAFWAAQGWRLLAVQSSDLGTWATGLMWLWIGTGQVASLQRLLAGPLHMTHTAFARLALALARLAAGAPLAEVAAELNAIAGSADRDAARTAARVLTAPPAPVTLSAAQQAVLSNAVAELDAYLAAQEDQPRLLASPVTLTLIGLNLAVFALEMARGSSEDTRNLVALGALSPPAIFGHGEWWRIIAALFLHLGWLHLSLNMLALAVLGRLCEKTLGHLRMLTIYAIAGVGSMAGLVALMRLGWMRQEVVVGASGAIMGLFGSLLASAATGWWRERSAAARRRLLGIAGLVALQAAGDIATPQVSFAGHSLGIALGLMVGLAVGGRTEHPTTIRFAGRTGPIGIRPVEVSQSAAAVGRRRALGGGLAAVVALTAALAYPQRLQQATNDTEEPPTLNPRNVSGIRRLQFRFFGEIMGGAPSVDPRAPFGSDDPLADLSRATGVTSPEELQRLYLEVMAALPRFCLEAHLAPALYPLGGRIVGVSAAQIVLIRVLRWEVPDEDEEVEVDPHTGSWPVASVNFKRPYGNMISFEADMAQALGVSLLRDASGHVVADQPALLQLDALHRAMADALQVFVRYATWPAAG